MKKVLSIFLSVAIVLSLAACGKNNGDLQNADKTSSVTSIQIVVPDDVEKPQFTVSKTDVYTHQLVRRIINPECKLYYATPKAKGKYETIIIMHGQGTVDKFKERLLTHINTWAKMGYIKPMVVVIPEVLTSYGPKSEPNESDIDDFSHYIYKSNPDRFNALLTSIETGELSPQIDTSIKPYVSGFSMGGMAALHAGVEYNDRIKHVGALSPARAFYLGEGRWSAICQYARDIQFSKEEGACVYLSAGEEERDFEGVRAFRDTINRYEIGIKVNNESIITKFIAPESWGGHSFEMAQKEIFMYLYLISNGQLPSNRLVEAICCNADDYTAPKVVFKEEEHT